MIDREKKHMEFLQERQQKQLEQKMQFELMQANMEASALGKLAQQQAKLEAQEIERTRKKKEYEEDKARRDAERLEIDKQEALQKEREQEMKAKLLMDKEKKRAELAQEKKLRVEREVLEKQKKQRRKIAMAREAQQAIEADTKARMAEKIALAEVRRRAFEEERERQQVAIREQAELKQEEIHRIKGKMEAVEARRKGELVRRQKAAQDRLVQKEEIKRRLEKDKRQGEIEKERQRLEVRKKSEHDYANNIEQMMERQVESEIAIEEKKREKQLTMDQKVRKNMLKRQLKMDKVDRSKRAVEYKRELALGKIEEDAARQRQIKAFKEAVADERKEMQRQAMLQQLEMERKVEAVKKKMAADSRKAAASVIEQAKKDLEAGEDESRPASSGGRASPSPQMKHTRKQTGSLKPIETPPKTPELGEFGSTPERPNGSAGMNRSHGGRRSQQGMGSSGKQSHAISREHKALMAEDQIQAMWRGQNEKLLRLLEEEEVREAEREQAIKAVQYEMMERQRLEREFDKERQDARERIVVMAQAHERQLLVRMTDLGLIGKEGNSHMVHA